MKVVLKVFLMIMLGTFISSVDVYRSRFVEPRYGVLLKLRKLL